MESHHIPSTPSSNRPSPLRQQNAVTPQMSGGPSGGPALRRPGSNEPAPLLTLFVNRNFNKIQRLLTEKNVHISIENHSL